MRKIAKYIILDITKSKVLIGYAALLAALCFTIFLADADPVKGLVSITTMVMIVVPLVSIVYTTTYLFNTAEFTELLVSQPLSRSHILLGKYLGVSVSVLAAYIIGVCLPVSLFAFSAAGIVLMLAGALLTMTFISLGFLCASFTNDKAKGIGASLMLWFYCSIIFDGLVLLFLFTFSEYPLEKAMILITALNPIDLARVLVLLQLDISALMGYTGALYQKLFGSGTGIAITLSLQVCWALFPILIAKKVFRKQDL